MDLQELNIALFRLINDSGKEFPFLDPLFVLCAQYTAFLLALGIAGFWLTGRRENRMMVISGGAAFVLAEIFGRIFGLFYSHDQPFAVLKDVNQLIEKAMEDMESIKIMRGINLGQKQKAG